MLNSSDTLFLFPGEYGVAINMFPPLILPRDVSCVVITVITVKLCIFVPPQDSSQIGLLKELLDLQKDMVVMLLSLLEGKGLFLGCLRFKLIFNLLLRPIKLLLLCSVFRKRGKWYHCAPDGRHVGRVFQQC